MQDATALALMRTREVLNRLRLILKEPILKIAVIAFFSVIFWYCLYMFFYLAFRFVARFAYGYDLMDAIIYLFFLALALMLVISNAIITYISIFKTRETPFLLTLPLRLETIFSYKLIESLFFSSWASLFLATPLLIAYGIFRDLSVNFYFFSFCFIIVFIFFTGVLGGLIAIFLMAYLPRSKRKILVVIGLAVIAWITYFGVSRVMYLRGSAAFGHAERFVKEIMQETDFSRNPLLPSYWVSSGILASSKSHIGNTLFYLLLILSNALFFGMVAYVVSGKLIIRGLVFSSESRRRKISSSVIYNIFEKLLYPVGKKISVIVTKDIKTFLRDPTQYVQFAIFLGLLALYFFNLRSFAYEKGDLSWRILVAQLNLFATALTLSTFTCRFVYPQLSIEGQRFWIMGMAPIARQKILISKFVLALVVTTITGEVLIVVSSYMLKTPPILFLLHIITVFSICFGLSGISVGLGAIYPNFKEANPAKIISGFGGTLNLVLNLGFVVLVITLQFVPCFLYFWRHNIQHETFRLWIIVALFGIVFLSASFALLTLLFGIRAIKRLEI